MRVHVKHGPTSHAFDLEDPTTLGALRQSIEDAVGVFARQQKLLCRGKVAADAGAGKDSTLLADIGIADGARVMLLSVGGAAPPRRASHAVTVRSCSVDHVACAATPRKRGGMGLRLPAEGWPHSRPWLLRQDPLRRLTCMDV